MKIPKEYSLLIILGLFLISYILEGLVAPLRLNLASPLEYFTRGHMSLFPFTTAILIIKIIAIFVTPLWLFSFFPSGYRAKSIILFISVALTLLYTLQSVSTRTATISLEWSISLFFGALFLLIPTLIYFIRSFFTTIKAVPSKDLGALTDTSDDWED